MMLDPAVLSSAFPHHRILHYWSKATLFANPVLSYVLYSSGNIPVDRKSKDRQVLFKGTFTELAKGNAVALFPEGTSYTEPRIMQVKDGASYAALEYTKWAAENPDKVKHPGEVVIVPAAIVYTNKSKYRSSVVMEFGSPIRMDAYKEQFLSGTEGSSRAAAKRLTRAIEKELVEATVNAPDWDTLYAARMARDLLWEEDSTVNMDNYVSICQTLVDLFATEDATPNFRFVRQRLLEYYSLLQYTNLTNSVLSSLPVPKNLDPRHPAPLPSRLLTLSILVRDTLAIAIRLPFVFFPLILHAPVYVMGRLGARLVEDEEETQAQNKVVFGLLLLLTIYPTVFWVLWATLSYTTTGALVSGLVVWSFSVYHTKIINDNYFHLKRMIAAWRVLVGVWAPKRLEMSLEGLSQYTTPRVPPESPWVDRARISRPPTPSADIASPLASPRAPAPVHAPNSTNKHGSTLAVPQTLNVNTADEPPAKGVGKRGRPSSRRIMRHVLRARGEAAKALAGCLGELQNAPAGKRVRAAPHLARLYGGFVEELPAANVAPSEDVQAEQGPVVVGWREAREVIAFLRKHGAKIAGLDRGIEAGWAAAMSDDEGNGTPTASEAEDLVWIPSGAQE
ncbi:glycerol-3-phosphate-acyltransferase [Coniophora puteana RWD-64-598 SS2]|uniref:Glycerol-3-phosphate-acyltransferase n=1 Tax=Coniophora puteana (strain RWD-64-598) TaxID=741705 RepID=A0A5M3MXY9_CONPW|nr:glycerol-3-phosphate-acyltransferase [Coniophora puteana RWD-64-598 SS2]EIW83501.1 glycerol-3-phosphate-acyltransferase [Coniophora puteana RWD-64-598 SS2]